LTYTACLEDDYKSCLIILPSGPDPLIVDKSIPLSLAIFLANGLAKILDPVFEFVDGIGAYLA
jgi:hypothetical protein